MHKDGMSELVKKSVRINEALKINRVEEITNEHALRMDLLSNKSLKACMTGIASYEHPELITRDILHMEGVREVFNESTKVKDIVNMDWIADLATSCSVDYFKGNESLKAYMTGIASYEYPELITRDILHMEGIREVFNESTKIKDIVNMDWIADLVANSSVDYFKAKELLGLSADLSYILNNPTSRLRELNLNTNLDNYLDDIDVEDSNSDIEKLRCLINQYGKNIYNKSYVMIRDPIQAMKIKTLASKVLFDLGILGPEICCHSELGLDNLITYLIQILINNGNDIFDERDKIIFILKTFVFWVKSTKRINIS